MTNVFVIQQDSTTPESEQLVRELRAAGVEASTIDDCQPGKNKKAYFRQQVQAADHVLVCWERDADEQSPSFAQIRDATGRLRERGPLSTFLIPVRLAECTFPDFPIDGVGSLTDLHAVDLFGKRRDKQLKRLLKALGGNPRAMPQPERPQPVYRDEHEQRLGERHRALQGRRKELIRQNAAAPELAEVKQALVDIKRQLRDGPQLKPGDWLADRYELLEQLGSGGFATVWRALDDEKGHSVAVKVLHGQFTGNDERIDRFRRGARAMQQLTHPHIVRVLEPSAECGGYIFFVMEYLGGGTFLQAVGAEQWSTERILDVVVQIAGALEHAHVQGAIHRDVTPDNILLDDSHASAKLTDFDLVRLADSTGGTRTGALGKYVYAAPESQMSAKDVDVRADVYSLAMTTIVALTGDKSASPLLTRKPEQIIDALDCSPELKATLKQGIEYEPDDRIDSMATLRAAFESECQLLRSADQDPPKREETVVSPSVVTKAQTKKSKSGTIPSKPAKKRSRKKKSSRVEVEMVPIEAGEFQMGRPKNEEGDPDELPQHRVVITQPFLLGKYAVTQAEYEAVIGKNPSQFTGNDRRPVEKVSWLDAIEFCNRLSDQHGLANYYQHSGNDVAIEGGEGFRLPTEAEWEYACRAGTTTRYNLGDAETDLKRAGWYSANADGTTHAVGEKEPNSWGLFDMHGNVYEWCWDWFADGYYKQSPTDDPRGPAGGSRRVSRGGCWYSSARLCRSAYRPCSDPSNRWHDLGFRVAQGPVR